jgi:hypothetical protein
MCRNIHWGVSRSQNQAWYYSEPKLWDTDFMDQHGLGLRLRVEGHGHQFDHIQRLGVLQPFIALGV